MWKAEEDIGFGSGREGVGQGRSCCVAELGCFERHLVLLSDAQAEGC